VKSIQKSIQYTDDTALLDNTDDTALLDYFRLFSKKKYIILICVFLAIIGSLVLSYTTIPVYRATAQLLIERKAPKALSIQDVVSFDSYQNDFFKTQYELLKDRALIKSVIQELKLEKSNELTGQPGNPLFSWVGEIPRFIKSTFGIKKPAKSGLEVPDPYSPLIGSFLEKLAVHPIINSRLVNISFEGYSPTLVKNIINNLAELYIQKSIFLRETIERDTQAWLKDESEKLKSSLEEAEQNLERFKGNKKIADFETKRFIARKKIDALSMQVVKIAGERVRLKALIYKIKEIGNDPLKLLHSLPKEIKNQELVQLSSDYSYLLAENQDVTNKYNRKHPVYKASRKKLKYFESTILTAIKGLMSSLSIQYGSILAQENSLNSALLTQRQFLAKLDSSSVQLKSLQRDVVIDGDLYKVLDSRFRELNVSSRYNESNIRLVYPAEIPGIPVRPNKALTLVIGSFIGLVLGFGLVLFLTSIDRKIKTIADVESAFSYPLLGSIPVFDSKESQMPVLDHPKTMDAEGFRIIAEKLISLERSTLQNVFMITSATVREGKSIVASNLAASLAQMGKKTIVIDADLRRPKIHELLHVGFNPGLMEWLIGDAKGDQVVKKIRNRFYAISAGTINQNPAIILNHQNFKEMIRVLKNRFEFVIVDSPPVWNMADAAMISRNCDGVIFVIKAGAHDKNMIQKSIDQLSNIPFTAKNGSPASIVNLREDEKQKQPTLSENSYRMGPVISGILFNYFDYKNENISNHYYNDYIKYYAADPMTAKRSIPLLRRLVGLKTRNRDL